MATSLFKLIAAMAIFSYAAVDEKPDARTVLDKAISAQGGREALMKCVAFHGKLKFTAPHVDKAVSGTAEIYTQGLRNARATVVNDTMKTRITEAVSGSSGWIKNGDNEAQAMTDLQVRRWQEDIYAKAVHRLVIITGEKFDISRLGERLVEGRAALGILVRNEGHDAIQLYFDKESYLLVMTSRRRMGVRSGSEVIEEDIYSDFRTVHGIKWPFKTVGYRNGKKILEGETTLLEVRDKALDDALFSKP